MSVRVAFSVKRGSFETGDFAGATAGMAGPSGVTDSVAAVVENALRELPTMGAVDGMTEVGCWCPRLPGSGNASSSESDNREMIMGAFRVLSIFPPVREFSRFRGMPPTLSG